MTLVAEVGVELGGFRLDVALTAAPGEVVALLGPNGAGKTTLLRALAGLVPLDVGGIALDGRALSDLPPEEREVGVVFQDYRLFPHLSALDNVAFPLRCRGSSRTEARHLALPWLERLGLAQQASSKPGSLSGGQAQRVALARALCSRPRLLLLDEPLAALDAGTRVDVRVVLQRALAAFEGPALLITHEPLDALSLADRVVVVEGGRVVQSAPPAELVRRPATHYVATLAGLNLLRGNASHGVLALEHGGTLVTATTDLDGPALAVVRPSAVLVERGRPEASSARNVLRAVVRDLQSLGDRVRVQVSGPPDLVVDVTPAAVADLRLVPGDEVWLSIKATDLEAYSV